MIFFCMRLMNRYTNARLTKHISPVYCLIKINFILYSVFCLSCSIVNFVKMKENKMRVTSEKCKIIASLEVIATYCGVLEKRYTVSDSIKETFKQSMHFDCANCTAAG